MRKPSGRIARREIRLLESEVKMLEHYHSQCVEIFDDYKTEWHADISYFVELFGGSNNDDQKEDFAKSNNEPSCAVHTHNPDMGQSNEKSGDDSEHDDAPLWAKKLYKKIAMIAHPDRISNEERRKILEKVFLRASDAVNTGKYEDLIAIALDFDISSGLDDITLKPVLKAQINNVKEKIAKIETEIPWVWGESFGAPSLRSKILKSMLTKKGIVKSDEELIAAIELREEQE